MSLRHGMLCPPDTFVPPSTTGLTTHGATFVIVLALYCLSFSGRLVMFRTVLRVRLEERFEMNLFSDCLSTSSLSEILQYFRFCNGNSKVY